MLFPDCGAGPSCDNPTPSGAAFDDALQLWTNRVRSSSVRKRLRAPLGSGASPSRRFQPRTEPAIRPLTPLVAPYSYPFYRAFAENQNRFHRPRVNENGFPDPRRLPSTSAPIAFAKGARHRTCSFAAAGRLPALFRPSRCSRREELDPDGGDGLFTRGRPDRAPLANFCNRNEMRAQLLDQSNLAHRA